MNGCSRASRLGLKSRRPTVIIGATQATSFLNMTKGFILDTHELNSQKALCMSSDPAALAPGESQNPPFATRPSASTCWGWTNPCLPLHLPMSLHPKVACPVPKGSRTTSSSHSQHTQHGYAALITAAEPCAPREPGARRTLLRRRPYTEMYAFPRSTWRNDADGLTD